MKVFARRQPHQPTKGYQLRRTAENKTRAEITPSLKRLIARETWTLMRPLREVGENEESVARFVHFDRRLIGRGSLG